MPKVYCIEMAMIQIENKMGIDKYVQRLSDRLTHKKKGQKKRAAKHNRPGEHHLQDESACLLKRSAKKYRCKITYVSSLPPVPIYKKARCGSKRLIADQHARDNKEIRPVQICSNMKSKHCEAEMPYDADSDSHLSCHNTMFSCFIMYLSSQFNSVNPDQDELKKTTSCSDSSCISDLEKGEGVDIPGTIEGEKSKIKFEGFEHDNYMNVHTKENEDAEKDAVLSVRDDENEDSNAEGGKGSKEIFRQDDQGSSYGENYGKDRSTTLSDQYQAEECKELMENLLLSCSPDRIFQEKLENNLLLSVQKDFDKENIPEDVKKPGEHEDSNSEDVTGSKEIFRQLLNQRNFSIRPQFLTVFMVPPVTKWYPTRIEDIPWPWLKEEKWRLHTFAKYPHNTAKSAILLAGDGFAYIGSGKGSDDKVICYFCRSVREKWQTDDIIPEIHRELDPQCPMVTNIECENIPLIAPANSSFLFPSLKKTYSSKAPTNNLSNARRNEIETDSVLEVATPASDNGAQTQSANRGGHVQMGTSTIMKPPARMPPDSSQTSSLAYQPSSNDAPSSTVTSSNTASGRGNPSQAQQRTPNIGNSQTSVAQNAQQTTRPEVSTSSVTSAQQSSSASSNVTSSRANTVTSGSTSTNATPSANATSGSQNSTSSATTNSSQSGGTGTGRGPTYNELGIITERPKRHEYAVRVKRLETFESWPREHHLKKEDLADAGFYYAGYGDCARCFYCGGGLRNWEDSDDVWVEHARWFPKCAFMRQRMGQAFVDAVQELNRDHDEISFETVIKKMGVTMSYFQIDSKETPLKRDPAVRSVVDMGFKEDDVLEAAITLKESGSNLSADKLFEKLEEDGRSRDKSVALPRPQPGSSSEDVSKIKETLAKLKEQNSQFRQQTVCKICMDKEVAVVFLPCGHLVSCADCAAAMKDCPVCRVNVKGIVRAFMS